ncbi:MAG: hypothetical protein AAF442_09865 [Pseudomonadota bacterium]
MVDKFLDKFLNPKQKQWAWFVILWCSGLGTVMLVGYIIRIAMGIE